MVGFEQSEGRRGAMPERESLYHEVPDYRVDLTRSSQRILVRFRGAVVADSRRALRVLETRHAPVLYFPREDVRFEHLERTEHRSFCPFKGEASYFSLRVGDHLEENAVWSYEDPFEQVAGLRDHVSFYPDRVDLEEPGG